MTEILVEIEGETPNQVETRLTWAVARGYCEEQCRARGVNPTRECPERFTEVFPWVTIG
jgi:hypothetical protein